ncbi:hypothetical protein ACN28S_08475 [Cystobacter fuscus]
MKSASLLSSLLGGLALLAAPAAKADLATSKPLFESRVASARTASSPGGATVLRQELITALDAFIVDGEVDAREASYRPPRCPAPRSSPAWRRRRRSTSSTSTS